MAKLFSIPAGPPVLPWMNPAWPAATVELNNDEVDLPDVRDPDTWIDGAKEYCHIRSLQTAYGGFPGPWASTIYTMQGMAIDAFHRGLQNSMPGLYDGEVNKVKVKLPVVSVET